MYGTRGFSCMLARENVTVVINSFVLQVIEDLNEECGKYGLILQVHVPRPSNPAALAQLFGTQHYGKVRSLVQAQVCSSTSAWQSLVGHNCQDSSAMNVLASAELFCEGGLIDSCHISVHICAFDCYLCQANSKSRQLV